ncbi:N-acetylglucosamine-6-phosphate deacetylase [Spiroplasma sp. SV19]|uniref:N-acetylglucosamine-6-phosphate deacetylase n=1 Tax=Spiroplasma sp. SV19 TaxID=2570468 RepID=UPI0024B80293|nr:N-acetylglucosamine-6-phosphate deacetylase [Spiroplasma sp. SV19]WHQ37398.1 N-acetylglucosamine-6-phosphate deacetylase [Spiroplasma sp. SV19]
MILKNAKIVCEDQVIANGWLEIKDNKIISINSGSTLEPGYDLQQAIIMPGFIDCHVHGGYGEDTEKGTITSFQKFAQEVAQEGITKYCQTIITGSDETITSILTVYQDYMANYNKGPQARQIGAHLEGPFISKVFKGAHDESLLQKPNIDLLKKWITASNDNIRIVTYAPEEEDGSFTKFLLEHNILPSIGHSNATFDLVAERVKMGVNHVTHLYNAMSKYDHRQPGVVPAVLNFNEVVGELISDGIHVNANIINLTYKIKKATGIALVTDAMLAKGLPDGEYQFGPLPVVKTGQKVVIKGTDTIAGSVATYDYCVRNFYHFTNCSLQELALVASTNIAKQLGIFDKTGSVAVGKLADLVVLDSELKVLMTLCEGEIAYSQLEGKQ